MCEFVGGCGDSQKSDFSSNRSNDDLCYDSDPTDLKTSATPICSSRSFVRCASTKVSGEQLSRKHDMRIIRHAITIDESNSDSESDSDNGSFDEHTYYDCAHENSVTKCINETINGKQNLIFHPMPDTQGRSLAPVHVVLWIEDGLILQRKLIFPKLMWKEYYDTNDKGYKANISHQGKINSIDLLDIIRILEINEMDRNKYPFAKLNNSFIVETINFTVLFEACSEKERGRIVNGLKLTVSRLASMIVVGDNAVFQTFFNRFGSEVPGKPPEWTEG